MAAHPYISGAGNISQMVSHLRKNFPSNVTSDTVKKLSIAPNNESYVINALQFVGVIDEEGKKTEAAAKVFSLHKDEDFQSGFAQLVQSAYSAIFDLHGEEAWALEKDDLIGFFRQSDQTSSTIGGRQANTYLVFAALAGYGELPSLRKVSTGTKSSKDAKPTAKPSKVSSKSAPTKVTIPSASSKNDVAITVRVEINLPGDGTKETYDNIFKSIRENLMNDG